MPLQHLLYRCPLCGTDATTPRSRGVRCESCDATFEQGRASVVLVRMADGTVEETSARALMDAIDAAEAALYGSRAQVGPLPYQARVEVARGDHHDAVWWRGRLLGFFERLRERREATLRLDDTHVTVSADGVEPLVWPLERIGAVQISSRAIQLNIRGMGLHQMEFLDDSPKRWETLLQGALQAFYATLGREVVEFQPRIVTRALS